jgi:2-polyprenyl-3-methyl-5-hydroxy-6-metoxy-1,4-benzoquinol methylase
MQQINVRQKDFYESLFDAYQIEGPVAVQAANVATNIWAQMRRRLVEMRRATGIDEQIYELHRKWLGDLTGSRILDLGCFTGNHLSLWIAENCAEYTGIDLSEQAVAVLNAKLRERQLTHACAYAQDFLASSYPDNYFDKIYAFSVLHHFNDMSVILQELHRVLKPGGVLISFDPLMTEPLNRFMRMLYRPLQTDRDWEWPFSYATFRLLLKYFEIADMRGFMGMVKLGFPLQMVPGLVHLGQVVGRWGLKFDDKYTQRLGLPFFLCWLATLCLRKLD